MHAADSFKFYWNSLKSCEFYFHKKNIKLELSVCKKMWQRCAPRRRDKMLKAETRQ